MKTLPHPGAVAMEATMFTGWTPTDSPSSPMRPALKVAHPLMLRAIAAAKKQERPHRCQQDLRLSALRFPLPE